MFDHGPTDHSVSPINKEAIIVIIAIKYMKDRDRPSKSRLMPIVLKMAQREMLPQ